MTSALPVQRTLTRDRAIFMRTGSEAVKYDLSTPNLVTITIPPFSKWTSGPHWHEEHFEYLQIVQGKALVTLGKSTWIHGKSDGTIEVKRRTIHEWRQYDTESGDLVVREWTDPADAQKEVFFRMLNSFLMEPDPQKLHRPVTVPLLGTWIEQYVVPLQLFVIFAAYDNWPVVLGQRRLLGWTITHLVLIFASTVGTVGLGLQPLYDEYIGYELRARVETGNMSRTDRKST